MKLQLALDLVDIPQAKKLVGEVQDLIDIVEIGTPFIIREGLKAVREIKQAFPNLELLADLKIMDAGAYEATLAYEAGADIVTVLGAANDITIEKVIEVTIQRHKKVMVDMIAVKNIAGRGRELDRLPISYLSVHTAADRHTQGDNPLVELQQVRQVIKNAGLAVAGGITVETLPQLIPFQPEIVIVGGAITSSPHPRQTALAMRQLIGEKKL
ncbi:MAG: 3-hexulose-6-phosphate synthase [Anaerolineae bacterium]|nr:3-hexulose-6-phosphate synthase [Anaerolineae bacterium]